jgi:hypothetical protein
VGAFQAGKSRIRVTETSCCGAYNWACQGGQFLVLRDTENGYEENRRAILLRLADVLTERFDLGMTAITRAVRAARDEWESLRARWAGRPHAVREEDENAWRRWVAANAVRLGDERAPADHPGARAPPPEASSCGDSRYQRDDHLLDLLEVSGSGGVGCRRG